MMLQPSTHTQIIFYMSWLLLAGCGSEEPFDYVKVSGRVTYEDGSLIPAEHLMLEFVPQIQPLDPMTFPKHGTCDVNVADGTFDTVTSHRYGDGIIRGKHKVAIHELNGDNQGPILIPAIYSSPDQTPLEVDTDQQTELEFKVKKP